MIDDNIILISELKNEVTVDAIHLVVWNDFCILLPVLWETPDTDGQLKLPSLKDMSLLFGYLTLYF